jgi:hypothetical protein
MMTLRYNIFEKARKKWHQSGKQTKEDCGIKKGLESTYHKITLNLLQNNLKKKTQRQDISLGPLLSAKTIKLHTISAHVQANQQQRQEKCSREFLPDDFPNSSFRKNPHE